MTIPDPTPADDVIDKQERVEFVVGNLIDANEVVGDAQNNLEFARVGVSVIAAPSAPGAAYVQAEMASLKTAIDEIRAALTASGVTA